MNITIKKGGQMKKVKGKSRKLKVLGVATLVIFAFSLSTVTAQESVNATGGNASGSGGSASHSVGQVVSTTNTGTNVTVTGAGTTASPYMVNATEGASLSIGDNYQGGIIFWLDATGQHGLIAATEDQSTGIKWCNGTFRYKGKTGDGLYAGAMNNATIITTQLKDNQTGNFAAKVCFDYIVRVDGEIYGDWYLPSKYELNLLYLQKDVVGGFTSTYYWSSTEYGYKYVWGQNFGNGHTSYFKENYTYRVRAIRAF